MNQIAEDRLVTCAKSGENLVVFLDCHKICKYSEECKDGKRRDCFMRDIYNMLAYYECQRFGDPGDGVVGPKEDKKHPSVCITDYYWVDGKWGWHWGCPHYAGGMEDGKCPHWPFPEKHCLYTDTNNIDLKDAEWAYPVY